MNVRRMVGLMVLALLAYGLSAATAAAPSKGEKIVADKTLFGADTSKALATRVELVLAMPPGAMSAGWAVPDPQPSIKDVQKKYGKADKVENRKKSDKMPEDSAVHWYGRVGLAVATGTSTGKVFWVLAE